VAGFVSEERIAFGPWQALERMLARLIEHSGFNEVMIVGGSGDQGADIVGTFQQKRYVLQAKFRQSGSINASACQEAVRALSVYNANIAIAAANQTFTQDAFDYQAQVRSNGIDLRLWDGFYLLDYFRKLNPDSKRAPELRSYQMEAVDAVEANRSRGEKNALVIMATGLGKSLVANALIANELDRNPNQEILVLAHMTDLVKQLEISSWPQLKKSYSTHLWTDGEFPTYSGGVIFATWQSILASLNKQLLEERFGLVIVDEAHHAPSHMFNQLLQKLRPNFLFGMTATPWRGDEINLENLFGPVTFSMDIVDGMQKGFLAEVDYRMLTDGIDWEEIAIMSKQGFSIQDLNAKLILPDRDIAIVEIFLKHFSQLENPRAMVFCRSIMHADMLQPMFAAYGIKTAILHSGLSREQRFVNLSSFRAGQLDCLLSVEMLNEGIDVPDVNLVAFMRVTHSRRIFLQQLGRGLRISPGKTKVIVLDFVADIRRIASAININSEAAKRGLTKEVIRFQDGRIIKFDNDAPISFFSEYLADIADIENLEDGARLKYPE
jgi:superfamily II DNA or RNA helicase